MDFIVPILMSIAESLLTKNLFASFLCEGLRKWADSADSEYDEKVVDAISSALGVDSTSVKELAKQAELKAAEAKK